MEIFVLYDSWIRRLRLWRIAWFYHGVCHGGCCLFQRFHSLSLPSLSKDARKDCRRRRQENRGEDRQGGQDPSIEEREKEHLWEIKLESPIFSQPLE